MNPITKNSAGGSEQTFRVLIETTHELYEVAKMTTDSPPAETMRELAALLRDTADVMEKNA